MTDSDNKTYQALLSVLDYCVMDPKVRRFILRIVSDNQNNIEWSTVSALIAEMYPRFSSARRVNPGNVTISLSELIEYLSDNTDWFDSIYYDFEDALEYTSDKFKDPDNLTRGEIQSYILEALDLGDCQYTIDGIAVDTYVESLCEEIIDYFAYT